MFSGVGIIKSNNNNFINCNWVLTCFPNGNSIENIVKSDFKLVINF